MNIGVPKEIKTRERRVSLTPAGAHALVERGHAVFIEDGAGAGSGIPNGAYEKAGAAIAPTAAEIWERADMIVKVKEPIDPEFSLMREGQILFAYLHLAPDEKQSRALMSSGVTAIAYETVRLDDGHLPLLAPMSEVAGRLSIQEGCVSLEAKNGGKGLLLSGVPGVAPGRVTIIGGGIAGVNAAHLAAGLGAEVRILDVSIERLRYLADIFHSRIVTLMSDRTAVERCVADADLVIGAVLIPGARAPKLVARELLARMEPGSAFVDISIDQGGCAETSRPTTHDDPRYVAEGVVHYCVANMPGAVPRTSTFALTNATLPYLVALADKGWKRAMADDPALARGLNVHRGAITCPEVAASLGVPCREIGFS